MSEQQGNETAMTATAPREWLWVPAFSLPVALVVGLLAKHHVLTGLIAFIVISAVLILARAVRSGATQRPPR